MKANTTLQLLKLRGEQEKSRKDGCVEDIANNKQQQTDNYIRAEGARALSEALKTNTSLTTLDLKSVKYQQSKTKPIWHTSISNRKWDQHYARNRTERYFEGQHSTYFSQNMEVKPHQFTTLHNSIDAHSSSPKGDLIA